MSGTAAGEAAAGEGELARADADGVARLWLRRPAKRNAISEALYVALRERLDEIGRDDSVRLVVLRSGVPGVFSAGADIATMADPQRGELERQFGLMLDCLDAFRSCPKPVLSVVDGNCLGVGCALAAASDIVVARADAQFALPEIRLGLAPILAMAALAPVVAERQLVLWASSGRLFPAAEAQAGGLVSMVAAPEELDAVVGELERALVGADGAALAEVKSTARIVYGANAATSRHLLMRNMLAAATAPAARQAIESFLQRRHRS